MTKIVGIDLSTCWIQSKPISFSQARPLPFSMMPNMNLRNQLLCLLIILSLFVGASAPVSGCSSFRVVTKDGHVFFVFNFELGAKPLTKVVFYPKGTEFLASAPNGRKAAHWSSKYAVTGMGWFDQPMIAGGVNEHGLACANLNLPNYTKYQTVGEKDDGSIIAAWDVPTYFLTQFKSVDEVRAAIPKIKVAMQNWKVLGQVLPIEFHYAIHDLSGASIVLEYIDGAPKVYENQLGVLTNSPDFEWHRVNLNNYINLTAKDVEPRQIADAKLISTGTGSGMLGLPGDYTPPSRFVRTVALSESAFPAQNHAEGLQSAFRISNAISFPEGPARMLMGESVFAGKTDFQMVADLSKKTMYFKHYDYPNWRSLNLTVVARRHEIPLVLDPAIGPPISGAELELKPKQ